MADFGAGDADLGHGVAEFQPVLGAVDHVGLGADQLDAVALQRAGFGRASSRCSARSARPWWAAARRASRGAMIFSTISGVIGSI